MGWDVYHATHYKNGKVDRKAECDEYWELGGDFRVLKSAMVGATYYAAVKKIKSGGKDLPVDQQIVFAAIFLTQVNSRDYDNIAVKEMDETSGPYYYDCPASILSLLSPTDNEWAIEWRKKCEEEQARKKSPTALKNLPVGSIISFRYGNEIVELEKHAPMAQFEKPFWYRAKNNTYFPVRRIPKNYTVLNMTC